MNLEHMCVSLPFVVCLYLLPHSHCSSFSVCDFAGGEACQFWQGSHSWGEGNYRGLHPNKQGWEVSHMNHKLSTGNLDLLTYSYTSLWSYSLSTIYSFSNMYKKVWIMLSSLPLVKLYGAIQMSRIRRLNSKILWLISDDQDVPAHKLNSTMWNVCGRLFLE